MHWARGSYSTISFLFFLRAMALILVVLPYPLLYDIFNSGFATLVFLSQLLAKAFPSGGQRASRHGSIGAAARSDSQPPFLPHFPPKGQFHHLGMSIPLDLAEALRL